MLIRQFVQRALYSPKFGYFCRPVVKSLPAPVCFARLADKREYLEMVAEYYRADDESWLTPLELFKPYYARAIGRYILRNHVPGPLHIFEVGGGNGTLADGILSMFKEHHPRVYEQTNYTIVEISAELAEKQRALVQKHGARCTVAVDDFTAGRVASREAGWVVALEVLDNLPHDKVVVEKDGSLSEVYLETDSTGEPMIDKELKRPLQDAALKHALDAFGLSDLLKQQQEKRSNSVLRRMLHEYGTSSAQRTVWVPTAAAAALLALKTNFPRAGLIFADYTTLEDTIGGLNSPAVQSRSNGKTTNHKSYLVDEVKAGRADVLFPTDFHSLSHAVEKICHVTPLIQTHGGFMRANTAEEDFPELRTKSGFCPLTDDFTNQALLLCPPIRRMQK